MGHAKVLNALLKNARFAMQMQLKFRGHAYFKSRARIVDGAASQKKWRPLADTQDLKRAENEIYDTGRESNLILQYRR